MSMENNGELEGLVEATTEEFSETPEKSTEPQREDFYSLHSNEDKIKWLLDNGIKETKEIYRRVYPEGNWKEKDPSPSYIYKIKNQYKDKKVEDKRGQLEGLKYVKSGEEELDELLKKELDTEDSDYTKEDITRREGGLSPEKMQRYAEGDMSSEDIAYAIKIIDSMYPEPYRPDEKSADFVAKLWVRPVNSLIAQYSDRNPLLVIAVVFTLMRYAPSTSKMLKDRREKAKREKEQKEEELNE